MLKVAIIDEELSNGNIIARLNDDLSACVRYIQINKRTEYCDTLQRQ